MVIQNMFQMRRLVLRAEAGMDEAESDELSFVKSTLMTSSTILAIRRVLIGRLTDFGAGFFGVAGFFR